MLSSKNIPQEAASPLGATAGLRQRTLKMLMDEEVPGEGQGRRERGQRWEGAAQSCLGTGAAVPRQLHAPSAAAASSSAHRWATGSSTGHRDPGVWMFSMGKD